MIIEVNYANHTGDGFGSRPYSYFCTIPDIRAGDLVKAPTGRGETLARVAAANIPEYRIPENILGMMKTVTERAERQEAPTPEPPPQQIGLDKLETASELALAVSEDVFKVEQLPVISEHLRSVKDEIEAMTKEAAGMVCTEDTIQIVKTERAKLNRTFTDLDARRKAVKAAVMAPYDRFEAVFKECVTTPFKEADAALKEKVAEVEAVQRDACEARLRLYFDEMCAVHSVDFVQFEQMGLKIDMASAKAKTPQKLMDRIGEFVAQVAVDVDDIMKMDAAAEVLAEYKTSLNLGRAVAAVQDRARRVREAEDAASRMAEENAKKEERAARVDAAAAAAAPEISEAPTKVEDTVLCCTFTVRTTREKLKNLKNFLITEGIEYESE